MTHKIIPILVSFWLISLVSIAQNQFLPTTSMPLTDLSGWQPTSPNWQIVGGARCNRAVTYDMATTNGTGILANKMTGKDKGNLISTFSHGDLDLELDVMMPKGSNSGIYLMGRYELQLLDSWGNSSPSFSDIGGIYQRWNDKATSGSEGYEGKAPRVNACRAPGLWQNLKISFQAPRFDANGKKVSNARFIKVILNDFLIQENVECSGPTRGAVQDQEVSLAPLLIQGDHGPIAFRNIRYGIFDKTPLKMDNLSYQVWYGKFSKLDDFSTRKPDGSGPAKIISWRLSNSFDEFALKIIGTVTVANAGTYNFTFSADGVSKLSIGGKTILDTAGQLRWYKRREVSANLTAGSQPFEIIVFKGNVKNSAGLSLSYNGPNIRQTLLSDPSSFNEERPRDAYYKEPGIKPELIRCFVKHQDRTLPYAAAISNPAGPHYEVNLLNNSLLRVWRGTFADMNGMYENRGGDQLLWFRGSSVEFADDPIIAPLANANAAWPDSVNQNFSFKGYSYSKPDGIPVINYIIDGANIADRWEPSLNNQVLTHLITANNVKAGLWVRLALGTNIETLADGSYLIDEGKFYVVPLNGLKPTIRLNNGRKELVYNLPANIASATTISYQLIW